jgi:dTMP kinase
MVFVVIDGLDASGKSSQASILGEYLRNQGKTVYLRFHPSTDNIFGMRAKQFLYSTGKSAHFAAAFFYMMDVIRSISLYSWRRFDFLVFVRYLMGTAYLPAPLDRIAYHFFAKLVPTSHQMFFLDVNPEEATRRLQETRERLEMFENLDELRHARRKAILLALIGGWTIIDANRPIENVQEAIRKSLQTQPEA